MYMCNVTRSFLIIPNVYVFLIYSIILYSYLMSEKSIDQNIFPKVLGTARCFLLPEANGGGQ